MQGLAHSVAHDSWEVAQLPPTKHYTVLQRCTTNCLVCRFFALTRCSLCSQVYQVTESALADILAAFQNSYNDLDDKLKQVQAAYDAFTASQFGNFGARLLLQLRPAPASAAHGNVLLS